MRESGDDPIGMRPSHLDGPDTLGDVEPLLANLFIEALSPLVEQHVGGR